MIGAARVVVDGDGLYRPDPTGEWAAVLPVYGSDGELGDLVAWFLEQPAHWWLRDGDEPILGARALAVAAFFGDPIRLYSTPERWLLAGGDGVVILKWDIGCHYVFDGVSRVDCDCQQLQRRFRKALRSWEPTVARAREIRHAE